MGGMRPDAFSVVLLFSLFPSHSPTRLFVLAVCSLESEVAQPWVGGFRLVFLSFVLSLSRSFFHFYKEYFNGTSRSNHGLCR